MTIALLQTQSRASVQVLESTVLRAGQLALRESGYGWFPSSDISVALGSQRPFELKLIGFKRIEILVEPNSLLRRAFEVLPDAKPNPVAGIEQMVWAMVRLFAGYYDICPWDSWRHGRLVDAAIWGAYRTWWPTQREEQVAVAVAAFFERCIVSHALTENAGEPFATGLACEKAINQHPSHLLSALWTRLMVLLFPRIWRPALAITPIEPEPVADALLPKVMRVLFGVQIRSVRGRVRIVGKSTRPRSWDWSARVEELAELLAEYVEQIPDGQQPGVSPFPHQNPASPGLGGDSGGTLPSVVPADDVNPFAANGQSLPRPLSPGQPGGHLPGRQRGPDRYNNYDEINNYYTQQANSLVIRDVVEEGPKRKPEHIPVGFQDYEKATPADLVTGAISIFHTRPVEPDKENPLGLQFFRGTEPFAIPVAPYDPGPVGLPNLMLVVDSSGSTKFGRDSSGQFIGKYHLVLLACWGIFRYIGQQENTGSVMACSINFSATTRSSGWHSLSALDPVKRNLAVFQGQGTALDTGVLRSAVEDSPGRFLAIIVTDGGLVNTVQALGELRNLVNAGNRLVHLHIDTPNDFTKGIEQMGCPVHIVKDPKDLVGLCIDLAKESYGRKKSAITGQGR